MRCLRCDHEWIAIVEKPVRCPKCISPYWDKPRRIQVQRRTDARISRVDTGDGGGSTGSTVIGSKSSPESDGDLLPNRERGTSIHRIVGQPSGETQLPSKQPKGIKRRDRKVADSRAGGSNSKFGARTNLPVSPSEKRDDEPRFQQSSILRGGASTQRLGEEDRREDDEVPGKLCKACEGAMMIKNGKWACADVTCGMYGQQQGNA